MTKPLTTRRIITVILALTAGTALIALLAGAITFTVWKLFIEAPTPSAYELEQACHELPPVHSYATHGTATSPDEYLTLYTRVSGTTYHYTGTTRYTQSALIEQFEAYEIDGTTHMRETADDEWETRPPDDNLPPMSQSPLVIPHPSYLCPTLSETNRIGSEQLNSTLTYHFRSAFFQRPDPDTPEYTIETTTDTWVDANGRLVKRKYLAVTTAPHPDDPDGSPQVHTAHLLLTVSQINEDFDMHPPADIRERPRQ